MSSRNPQKIVDAICPVGTQPKGCALKLGEFTAGTVLLLQQIEHPILDDKQKRKTKVKGKSVSIPMSDVQIMQLVFLLARTVEESFDLLAAGRSAFDRAVYAFAGTLPIGALPELGAKVAEAFARAVSTVLPGADSGEKKTG